jgi:hypothetical protein
VYFFSNRVAIGSVIYYGVLDHNIHPPTSEYYPPFIFDTYPIFFSTVAFLYIQPSTLFPIANSMREPRKFNMVQVCNEGMFIEPYLGN